MDDELSTVGSPQSRGVKSPAKSRHRQRGDDNSDFSEFSGGSSNNGNNLRETLSLDTAIRSIRDDGSPSNRIKLSRPDCRSTKVARSRSRSPRKTGMTTEMLLMQLRPPVAFHQLREWYDKFPQQDLFPAAERLLLTVETAASEQAFIPNTLRHHFERETPKILRSIHSRDDMFYASSCGNDWDESLWRLVANIMDNTSDIKDRSETELTGITVEPILTLVTNKAAQKTSMSTPGAAEVVQHHNVSQTPTVTRAGSVASSNMSDLDSLLSGESANAASAIGRKRIDHVLSISFQSCFQTVGQGNKGKINLMRVQTLNRLCQLRGYSASINQTTLFPSDAFLMGIEVKKARSTVAPEIQLGAWMSAGQSIASELGFDVNIPRIAATVVGHEWFIYIACAVDEGEGLICIGPTVIGNTRTMQGIFRIVHVLRAVVKWGNTSFREMVRKGVIDKLQTS